MFLYGVEKREWQISFLLILSLIGIVGSIPHGAQAALIACPSGYTCLTNSNAIAQWGQGNFVQYSGDACSVDIDFTVYSYCYAPKPQQTCPSGYQCMAENAAIARWGQGNYKKYFNASCGNSGVSTPIFTLYYCFAQNTVGPVCTPPACKPGEVLYCPGQCPNGCGAQCIVPTTITPTSFTPTTIPPPVCTYPACKSGEVLYCPGQCLGGCGVQCIVPTTPPSVPNANFIFSGTVYEWRFDPGQDMHKEAPHYIRRVNDQEILLFGSYSPTGYDVANYIASNRTNGNGDYTISLGSDPHRNFTYYYLSPTGVFPGGPWQYFNASSLEGKIHESTYGKVIYYSTPLTGTGKVNDFVFFTQNTSQTILNPSLVATNSTVVPPMNIVTPAGIVLQTSNNNIVFRIFSSIAEFFRGVFGANNVPSAGITPVLTTPVKCSPPFPFDCNGSCVDLTSDPLNCGYCGYSCPQGLSCWNSRCGEGVCENGGMICSGVCHDILDENNNCGGCGNVCPANTSCIDGYCASPDSLPSYAWCGNIIDPRNDPANCGGCRHVCTSTQSCVNGQCVSPEERYQLSRNIASQIPNPVNKININAVTVLSECIPRGIGQISTDSGREFVYCPEGSICNNGICLTCNSTGQMICSQDPCSKWGNGIQCRLPAREECVNTLSDTKNCGGCGIVCQNNKVCNNGQCTNPTCPSSNELYCGMWHGFRLNCIDVQSNPGHCGSCDNTCPTEQPCCCHGECTAVVNHQCSCPDESVVCNSGQTKCNNICVDTSTNAQNCGSCGYTCAHNCGCENGKCCPAAFDSELKTWTCDC